MMVDYNSLSKTINKLLGQSQFGQHQARQTSMSVMLQGLLHMCESSLSSMARGSVLLDEYKTFRGQLKRAYRLTSNPNLDPWELGSSLFSTLTESLEVVLVAVDWTKVGKYMMLEASLVVEGRGIPFYGRAILKEDLAGRQRTMELGMEYALAAMVLEKQVIQMVVDRGFAALDYVGPSSLYPSVHRITRLKKNMILQWDDCIAPLEQWPLWEGETVEVEKAILGRKKIIFTGVVLANIGQPCYLACHPKDRDQALKAYEKRVWIEEQNRDLKTGFKFHLSRFFRAIRVERMWGIMGIAFAIIYSAARQLEQQRDRFSRKYEDGRKDLSWLSLAKAVHSVTAIKAEITPIGGQ